MRRLGARDSIPRAHLLELRPREPRRGEVLHGVRHAARCGFRSPRRRGTQGRHRAVLRPRRVHRHLGVRRPRGRRPDARRLLRDGPRRRSRLTAGWSRSSSATRSSGVFGVPAAHEDDPERAVRAGLRICEDAEELTAVGGAPLRLRVGINTGEALVRLGVIAGLGGAVPRRRRDQHRLADPVGRPRDGRRGRPRHLRGDRAGLRLRGARARDAQGQGRAGAGVPREGPAGSVRHRPHPHPRHPVHRSRDRPRAAEGHLRQDGRGRLAPARHRGRGAGSRQEPDRRRARRLHRRQARPRSPGARGAACPTGRASPSGRSGEIVKAHAGHPRVRSARRSPPTKLEAVLPEGDERPWFRQRLLPLLGIEATSHRRARGAVHRLAAVPRAHRRAATRPCSCSRTCTGPTTRCSRSSSTSPTGPRRVPLLVVGTARPELFERHPDYAAGLRNANPINLAPLSEEETARLVSALLETTVIPAELQQPILERAGGNPLYAEEFVRLLKDRDLLVKKGASWELREGAEVPFPDSVQALIAARLDTLSADTKSMLADAAVIGKVFWAGAIAQMGERDLTDGHRDAPGALPQGARASRPAVLDRGRGRVRVLARARPRRRLRAAPESLPSLPSRRRRALDRVQGPRAGRGPRRRPRLPLRDRPGARAGRRADRAGRRARGTGAAGSCPWPGSVRSAWTPPRPSRTSNGRSRSPPQDTPNVPRRSPASARPPCRPGATPRRPTALEEAIAVVPAARRDPRRRPRDGHARQRVRTSSGIRGSGRSRRRRSRSLSRSVPPPQLVAALTEVAVADALQGRSEDAIRVADRALALAERARARPPRARPRLPGAGRADLG